MANKKVIAIVIVVALLAAAGGGIFAYTQMKGDDQSISDLKWGGTTISNYSDYEYIGAGSVASQTTSENAGSTGACFMPFGDSSIKNAKLVGITQKDKTKECTEISMTDGNGNTVKQDANLLRYMSFERYSLAIYSTTEDAYRDSTADRNVQYHICEIKLARGILSVDIWGCDTYSYSKISELPSDHYDNVSAFIIDNKNGNIYSIRTTMTNANLSVLKLFKDSFDYDYLLGVGYIYKDVTEACVIKCDFTSNTMNVKVVMTNEQIKSVFSACTDTLDVGEYMNCDRYGNIYASGSVTSMKDTLTLTPSSKYQKGADCAFKSLKSAEKDYDQTKFYKYNLAFNGILYERCYNDQGCTDLQYTAYMSENGSFVHTDALDVCSGVVKNRQGNDYILLDVTGVSQNTVVMRNITVDKANVWKYTVNNNTTIGTYNGDSTNTASTACYIEIFKASANQSHLYVFDEDKIKDYSFDGTFITINSANEIVRMYSDKGLGVEKLVALDGPTQKQIMGYIDETKAGDAKIIMEEYSYKIGPAAIYVITPVNVK